MPKRFVLMRKYAYLREQLDEKLLEDKLKQSQLNDKNLCPSIKDQLKNGLLKETSTVNNHRSITSFKSLKDEVYKSFVNFEEDQGIKWTRFPGLNKILKGHRPGELTIFTGKFSKL